MSSSKQYQDFYNKSARYQLQAHEYLWLAALDKACALCGELFDEFHKPVIDHAHECSNRHNHMVRDETKGYEYGCPECIRGLLCHVCNIRLGQIEEAMTYGEVIPSPKIVEYLGRRPMRECAPF